MNITFVLGNGFDLSYGLKTSYSSFYEWYLKKYPEDYFTKEIREDFDNWADLEWALGKQTKKFNGVSTFLKEKEKLDMRLSEYLTSESKRIVVHAEEGQLFRNAITDFSRFLNEDDKTSYVQLLKDSCGVINYHTVTLNYTPLLDNLYEEAIKIVNPRLCHTAGNGVTYGDILAQPVYLHGRLNDWDDGIILGVGTQDQIDNLEFKTAPRCTEYLIKTKINEKLGNGRIRRIESILSKSVYVCIFGASLGKTDYPLWHNIANLLMKDNKCRIILFWRDEVFVGGTATAKLRIEDEIKDLFLERAGMKEKENEIIRNRISICLNKSLFDWKGVKSVHD